MTNKFFSNLKFGRKKEARRNKTTHFCHKITNITV